MATAGDGHDVQTIRLSGPVTLYESAEVRETLLVALGDAIDLRVDLETSGPWDLAGLQLLISVVNTGQKRGKTVKLVQVPGVCRTIAERSGLTDWLDVAAESFH
jgi:ABC-type transporter Mla MlaB component